MDDRTATARSKAHILTIIFEALGELNDALESSERLALSPETLLYGEDGQLDSLQLVELLICSEQRLEDEFGVSMTLADERALARTTSPFRSVATLVDYVEERLEGDDR